MDFLLEVTLKTGALLAVALVAARFCPRLSAAERHVALMVALVASVVFPAISLLLPPLQIPLSFRESCLECGSHAATFTSGSSASAEVDPSPEESRESEPVTPRATEQGSVASEGGSKPRGLRNGGDSGRCLS